MSLERLRRKLKAKQGRVNLRYNFYEAKNYARDLGISTPPQLQWLKSALGWNALAVDKLADRLVLRGFKNDFFNLSQIYQINNLPALTDGAILDALIAACSFLMIDQESDYPRIVGIDAANATGDIDPRTGFLEEGYAVLERDRRGKPIREAHFMPFLTDYYENGELVAHYQHPCKYPLLVPIVFRPDARRPFGHSRISRSCMNYTTAAMRTLKRSEVASEFFSFPQRWAVGLDENFEKLDKWRATMSSLLQFEVNQDGQNHVSLGQFQQGSMEPHVDQIKMLASLYAGETGLTLDDLGFPTAVPSSAEAIKASHDTLRGIGRKAQRTFSTGFLNAGLCAASIRDGQTYDRRQIYNTSTTWGPLFEPDAAALGAIGDGLAKIAQTYPDAIPPETISEMLGV